ncbi:hypothetical protein SAMN05216327_11171 [Dyadobacter sp. SG02]|uniref:hypothetical protein n=1 Tax=Dyadobacter sp. SG02 TaxID=1855291 RepID=UPI0008C4773A|nr:hypothetical protein [Dyadobacter sp. SG02]SEJ48156.1 hypothetical protein SAMN05216327_11171 [Dyadobacter sp. SG02]
MDMKKLEDLHEWSEKVARLIELVAFTNKTLQLHRELGDTPSIIRQYERLLAQHQQELDDLLKTYGLAIKLLPLETAA